MSVARVTNREQERQTFPSEASRLAGGTIVYCADDELFRVAAPAPADFAPLHRFDSPKLVAAEGVSPDFGTVRIRRPNTQSGLDVVEPASGRVFLRYDGCPDTTSNGCGTGWGIFAAIDTTGRVNKQEI